MKFWTLTENRILNILVKQKFTVSLELNSLRFWLKKWFFFVIIISFVEIIMFKHVYKIQSNLYENLKNIDEKKYVETSSEKCWPDFEFKILYEFDWLKWDVSQ